MPANIFLKITKAPSASKVEKFTGQIEVMSFRHEVRFPMTLGQRSITEGKRQGRCEHEAFSITKKADKSSPNLFMYCSKGEEVGTAKISVQGNDNSEIFSYELEEVFITSISVDGDAGDDPTETVLLDYSSIKWTQGSSNSTGWDLEKNTKK